MLVVIGSEFCKQRNPSLIGALSKKASSLRTDYGSTHPQYVDSEKNLIVRTPIRIFHLLIANILNNFWIFDSETSVIIIPDNLANMNAQILSSLVTVRVGRGSFSQS